MARVLEIDVKVNTADAKRELAAVDQQVAAVSNTTSSKLLGAFDKLDASLKKLTSGLSNARGMLNGVAEAAGITFNELGLVGSAGLAIGAGMEGWQLGRAIAEFFDLDTKIANATASLLHFGDVSGQTAGAKLDTINAAIAHGAAATVTYTDAIKFNTQWSKNQAEAWQFLGDVAARQNAPKEFADQMVRWRAEINSVQEAGALPGLKAGLESHIITVKELSASYRISEGAINLFKEQLKQSAEAAKKAAADHEAAVKRMKEANDKWLNSIHDLKINTEELVIAGLPMVGLIGDLGNAARDHMRDLQPLDSTLFDLGTVTLPHVTSSLKEATGGFKSFFGNIFEGLKGKLDLGNILNSMIGSGLSGLISGGVSLLTKGVTSLFSKIFGGDKEAKQVRDMRDQFIAAAGGLSELQKHAAEAGVTLDAMLNAKKVDAFKDAVASLQSEFDGFNEDQKRAKELIDEYGIKLDQLGPKFRQQQLNEQAKGVMNDFRLMVDVLGIDAPVAMDLMKDKINAFVHAARLTGSEVPASMRPMLEAFTQQGLLTDESGKKIEKLDDAGLIFSESFTAGIDRIVKKFDELIGRLFGATDAINQIPSRKDVEVIYHERRDDQRDDFAQRFHEGGVVVPFAIRAHRGLAVDEVPIIAQTGEGIVNRRAMRQIGGAAGLNQLNAGGASGGVNVSIGGITVGQDMSESEAEHEIGRKVVAGMRKQGIRFSNR